MLVTKDKGVTVIADGPVFIDKEAGLVRVRVPQKVSIQVINIDSRQGTDWCAPDPDDPLVETMMVHIAFDDPSLVSAIVPPSVDVFDASFADDMNSGGFVSNEFLGAGSFKIVAHSDLEVKVRVDNLCANFPKFILQIRF